MWINKIYKLILNLSVREGHTKCLANPPQLVITFTLDVWRLMSDVWLISTPQSTQIMETKKTWEYVSHRAYPYHQAFALPLHEDKQLKACPRRDNICIHHGMTHPKQHSCTVHIQYTYKYTATHIHNNERIPISGHTPYYIYKKGKWLP